jgi:menaquinone-dependent protoporphyrinogen IX oxidase
MSKKSLIIYHSLTGNTEKVVNRFKQVLEKRGWRCDLLRIDKKTDVNVSPSPFDCNNYDLFCVGSGVYQSLPSEKVIAIMKNNPQSIHYEPSLIGKAVSQIPPNGDLPDYVPPTSRHIKTVLGPDAPKGIVFVTFGGHEFGPIEAVPALETLALEMMHLKINCIGKFSCPGKFGKGNKNVYFKNSDERPDERDLMKAEIFLEEVLDELD